MCNYVLICVEHMLQARTVHQRIGPTAPSMVTSNCAQPDGCGCDLNAVLAGVRTSLASMPKQGHQMQLPSKLVVGDVLLQLMRLLCNSLHAWSAIDSH